MTDYVPMTREAYDRKKVEIGRLENEEIPKIAENIAAARAEGDLSENAEYHAQREAMGMLQAKINHMRGELARASIVDPSKMPKDEVAFGATVTVKESRLRGRRTVHAGRRWRRELRRWTLPDHESDRAGLAWKEKRGQGRDRGPQG